MNNPYQVHAAKETPATFPQSTLGRAVLLLPLLTLFSTSFFTFTDSSWDGRTSSGYRSEFHIGCWPPFAKYHQFLWWSNNPAIDRPAYPQGFSVQPASLLWAVTIHFLVSVAFCRIARRLLDSIHSTIRFCLVCAITLGTATAAISVRLLPSFEDHSVAFSFLAGVSVLVAVSVMSAVSRAYSIAVLLSVFSSLSYFWGHRIYLIYWQLKEDYASVGQVKYDDLIELAVLFSITVLVSSAAVGIAKRQGRQNG